MHFANELHVKEVIENSEHRRYIHISICNRGMYYALIVK